MASPRGALAARAVLLLFALALHACSAGAAPASVPESTPASQSLAAPASASAPGRITITILHTNDHHGHVWPWRSAGRQVGGLAARAALVARIRAEVAKQGGHVLLLDGGDFNTGSYCSDELRAEPDLQGYRRMGYQAAAAGNHEFDQSYEVLRRQAEQAGFPLLAANVVLRNGGRTALGDVAEWVPGGVRVVALGLAPGDTPTSSTQGKDPRLRFLDPTSVAAARVPALRARGRVVVGLFHLPLEEIARLVSAVPGIDVVVSGHDHVPLAQPLRAGRTTIVQAGADGLFLGRVDLEVPVRGPVVVRGTRLYPIGRDLPETRDAAEDLPEVREVAEALAAFRTRCMGDAVVGRLAAAAERDAHVDGPGTPSPLHNLVADALRAAAGADVAFTNRGGLRASLPAGPITRQQIHEVLPFADTLTVYAITGADLLKLVDEMSRRQPGGKGALYPAGVSIRFHGPGRAEVRRAGRLVQPRDHLTLAVTTFIADGGDGYKAFATFPAGRVLPLSPKAALESYIRAHDPAQPPCEARTQWDRTAAHRAPAPCPLTAPRW
jgi:5'-nucleotidase / UDP-sugar diphosphatase